MEQPIENEECRTWGEYILYKLDRTLAILGIVAIAVSALVIPVIAESKEICAAGISVLGVYIGGRSK